MGMNEEFLKIIFDPFTRARNSTNSGIQGTGLGMAITKNLVDLMNGTIDIESHENEGTKTVVRFTFAISEPVEFKSSNSDASMNISLDGMKVLLVDVAHDGESAVGSAVNAIAGSQNTENVQTLTTIFEGFKDIDFDAEIISGSTLREMFPNP